MQAQITRPTVDLSEYLDLVLMYLGMQANSLRGVRTGIGFGRRIKQAVDAESDGLLPTR